MLAVSDLPTLNAILNGTAFILLMTGFYFIKQQRWKAHRIAMISAFSMSVIFLISYLTHYYYEGTTPYDGEGVIRFIYFYIVLVPHVILAATVPFLAMATLYQAWKDPWSGSHRKIARITFPIWIYVSLTGVLVYLMLRTSLFDAFK